MSGGKSVLGGRVPRPVQQPARVGSTSARDTQLLLPRASPKTSECSCWKIRVISGVMHIKISAVSS